MRIYAYWWKGADGGQSDHVCRFGDDNYSSSDAPLIYYNIEFRLVSGLANSIT